ncbi:MarR family transcriptional regulator [Vibrio sp. D404a]|jgi:DNA-binding MarR family transcriptional regulator|uniref:MarR family winged helix-turn-helix transcriptional regulator n=1 Tax=Vibrio TaxID=662 RepID=UPI002556352E|nr:MULTISPECIES: MarR family transcriptional regulator [unclassified Vibrio]MDK9740096.1 MarR family transcriptional regulator [Vibrio sp. D404a]MDK9799337.1 MarR family transcriptional regulator [Vibrio sp. D449a]
MSEGKSLDSLFKLVHAVKRNVHEKIEALDLDIAPMHVRVLKIITKKPQCTAVDIANFLDRDKAQVTRLLSALIKQELIVKEPNPEDKRSQCLAITERGKAIVDQLSEVDSEMFEKMKIGIDSDELATFERVAKAMAQNLNSKG